MEFAIWSVLIGVLLILLALSGTVLSRLPLSTAMLYLMAGLAVSPFGLGLMAVDPRAHTLLLERLTEVVVLVSLFTAGPQAESGPEGPALAAAAAAGPDLDGDHGAGDRRRGLAVPGLAAGRVRAAGRRSSRPPIRCWPRTCRCSGRATATGCASP